MALPAAPHQCRGALPNRLLALIERSTTPMIVFDEAHGVVEANAALASLFGVKRTDIIGREAGELSSADLRSVVEARFRDLLAEGSQVGQWGLALPGGEVLEIDYCATANVAQGCHLIVCTPSRGEPEPALAHRPMARPLTSRELEILEMVALGSTGEQIAEQLVLSPETVQKHVQNAKRKIGAETRAHMIALALKRRLINPLLIV